MMDYASRSGIPLPAARTHVRKLQVLQPKCLRIANAPWYIGNRQIHVDMGIPFFFFFFADHIRALTESFDSKLFDVGELLSSATWKTRTSTKGCLKSLMVNRRGRMYSRSVEATPTRRPSRRNMQYPTLLGYPD
jgi:hypothetical protein